MSPPQIRPMLPSDVEEVVSIYAEVLSPAYISFTEIGEGKAADPRELAPQAVEIFQRQLIGYVGNPSHGCFVAHRNDAALTGFVLVSLRRTEAGLVECWLDDVCVRVQARSSGVGTALVDAALAWAKQGGAGYALLESGIRNHEAHELFSRRGFEPVSTVFWRSLP